MLTLGVLHPSVASTRGRSERFAWAGCSTRIPLRRILHHPQAAASLLQNAYSAPSPPPPPSRSPASVYWWRAESLARLCLPRASALRVLSSQHVCFPPGFLGSAVGDGGDALEAIHRGDAITFASALMEGASLYCESEGTPNIKSDAIMRRRCCSLTAPRPGPLVNLPPSPSCTFVVEVTASLLYRPRYSGTHFLHPGDEASHEKLPK